MTALEEYTSSHSESVEDIMYRWPWRRFEGMFRRHLLRKAREELRQMRDMRLAAMDANTNFDSSENQQARTSRAEALQDSFREAERMLYSNKESEPQSDEYGDDPLFDPLRRAKTLQTEANRPLVKQAGMGRQLLEAMDS